MQARVREVLTHLESHRTALEAAVASIPEVVRDRRPGADRWSVAEILEHLVIVETRIALLLTETIETARASGLRLETDTAPVVPTVPVASLLDRSARIVARENSVPTGKLDAAAGLALLAQARQALKETLLAADGLALGELVLPHPRLGALSVYQWFVFLGAHEGRHAAQIREVGGALERSR